MSRESPALYSKAQEVLWKLFSKWYPTVTIDIPEHELEAFKQFRQKQQPLPLPERQPEKKKDTDVLPRQLIAPYEEAAVRFMFSTRVPVSYLVGPSFENYARELSQKYRSMMSEAGALYLGGDAFYMTVSGSDTRTRWMAVMGFLAVDFSDDLNGTSYTIITFGVNPFAGELVLEASDLITDGVVELGFTVCRNTQPSLDRMLPASVAINIPCYRHEKCVIYTNFANSSVKVPGNIVDPLRRARLMSEELNSRVKTIARNYESHTATFIKGYQWLANLATSMCKHRDLWLSPLQTRYGQVAELRLDYLSNPLRVDGRSLTDGATTNEFGTVTLVGATLKPDAGYLLPGEYSLQLLAFVSEQQKVVLSVRTSALPQKIAALKSCTVSFSLKEGLPEFSEPLFLKLQDLLAKGIELCSADPLSALSCGFPQGLEAKVQNRVISTYQQFSANFNVDVLHKWLRAMNPPSSGRVVNTWMEVCQTDISPTPALPSPMAPVILLATWSVNNSENTRAVLFALSSQRLFVAQSARSHFAIDHRSAEPVTLSRAHWVAISEFSEPYIEFKWMSQELQRQFSRKEDGIGTSSILIGHASSSVLQQQQESHLSYCSWTFSARLALALRYVSSGHHVHELFSSCDKLTPASDLFWIESSSSSEVSAWWPRPLYLVLVSSYLRTRPFPGGRYISIPNSFRLFLDLATGKIGAWIAPEVSRATQQKVHKILKEKLDEFNDHQNIDIFREQQLNSVLKDIDKVFGSEAMMYD